MYGYVGNPKTNHSNYGKIRLLILLELSVNYFGAKCKLYWKFFSKVSFVENRV